MLDHTDTTLSFPDSLISRSQCLAGAVERASPSVSDVADLLMEIPADLGTNTRLVVRRVLMRVFGHFVRGLDVTRDADSIQAFVAWSGSDPSSEHCREDVFALVPVWRATQRKTIRGHAMVVGDAADSRIRQAFEVIDRRYAEPPLTLRDVARAANLSVGEAALGLVCPSL